MMHTFLVVLCLLSSPDPSRDTSGSPSDLSGTWQLFVDDVGIHSMINLSRTYHVFDKYPSNPVLVPEHPWEGSTVYVYGTVLPGEEGTGYRMWYHSWAGGEYHNLYATSPDGIHWTKPDLDIVDYEGNTNNNILFRRTREDHNPQVIHTPWESDPGKRYKLINWDYGRTPPANTISGYYGACSPDGIHWTDVPNNPVLRDPTGDVGNFTWDALAGRYIGYPKIFNEIRGFRRRCVGFSATTDFNSWPTQTTVLVPDEYDDRWANQEGHHTDFYGLCAFPYESMYLGFLWIFRITGPGDDGPIFVELVSSRDGIHWTRQEAPRSPILPLGSEGSWDSGMIFTVNHPLVEGGVIKLYYGGFDATHAVETANGAIGFATLRKDGFASLDAGQEEGSVTTVLLNSPGDTLAVNYCCRDGGILAVEVLDAQGTPVEGYGRDDCLPLSGDDLRAPVTWKMHSQLPQLNGGIRLRFLFRKASLYSYNIPRRIHISSAFTQAPYEWRMTWPKRNCIDYPTRIM